MTSNTPAVWPPGRIASHRIPAIWTQSTVSMNNTYHSSTQCSFTTFTHNTCQTISRATDMKLDMKLDTRIFEDSGNFTFGSDEDSNSLDHYPFSIAALLKVFALTVIIDFLVSIITCCIERKFFIRSPVLINY